MRRLTLPGADVQLDPQVRELAEAAVDAVSQATPQLPDAPAVRDPTESILRAAIDNPRLAVVQLVADIEVRVRDLAAITGHQQPRRTSWPDLVQWLVRQGTLPPGVASAVDLIRPVRNRIAHGTDRELDDRDVIAVMDSGLRLLRVLEAIPDYGYEVRALVPVYRDSAGTLERNDGRGVILWDFDALGQHRDYRIYPTRRIYSEGERVGWQWSFDKTWDETYWRDPWDDDTMKLAWSQSAEFVGDPLLRQDAPSS